MRRGPLLFACALAVLTLLLLAVHPALAHHKPNHRHGPATTTTLPATTTTGAMATTTTTIMGNSDPSQGRYGPRADYTQPPGSTSVAVGNLNQALIDGASAGTVFWLQAGTHRPAAEIATMLVPKANMEFHGAPGAILSGSKILTGWTSDGAGHWFVDGQTQRGVDGTETFGGNPVSPTDFPRGWKSETLFLDGVIQKHQNTLADANTAGEWFFDYAADRIYTATNPANFTLAETTIADRAIVGGGAGVIIRNLVVEQFMSALQVAAVDSSPQTGWRVIDCDVRRNHGIGLKASDGAQVTGTRVFENGQMGVAGGGSGVIWDANEISYNNTIGIASGWEGGGSKFVFASDLTVMNNWVHHNDGPGLWSDIHNDRVLYTGNLAEHNARMGIFHEISYAATIRNNTSRYNGTDVPGQGANYNAEGAGIVVTTSGPVEVSQNIVLDNSGGGIVGIRDARAAGPDGYELAGLSVHDNHVTMHTGLPGVGAGTPMNGIDDLTGTTAFQAAAANRFEANTYVVGSTSTTFWVWNGAKTWAQWQAVPQDATGTATVG